MIRVKMIVTFFLSVGLAVAGMLVLGGILVIASVSQGFAVFFHAHLWLFGPLLVVIFAALVIVFFLMLIQDEVKYLEEITRALGTISEGDLSVRLSVRDGDELGKMAQTVNDMARKLTQAIEEERRVEKEKNDLIVNISHDLRTPLTSVLGYLELIENTPKDGEDLKKYAGIARDKCKSLSALIDGLFEYARLNDAQMALRKNPISMGELLEQVVMGFIPEMQDRGIGYRLDFADEKCMAEADPALLMRVYNNLIHNAIVHGGEGKYVDIELERSGGQVIARVVSYGRMIPEDELPHVFDKFYQADRTDPKGRGAGLGLAIAKRIVELHGGAIRASSAEGKTVFEISLPASGG